MKMGVVVSENMKGKITPDNTVDLYSVLSDNPETYRDYLYIENLTKAALFSKFPERKKEAMKSLRTVFNPCTTVETLEGQGMVYGYLSVLKDKDAFLFVGKYPKDATYLELAPDRKELRRWRREEYF